MATKAKAYRMGSDDLWGTVTFGPGDRIHEEPAPGQERTFGHWLGRFKETHGDDVEGLIHWLEMQASVSPHGGFWVEKARPDGTFESDDPDDEEEEPPGRLARSPSGVIRHALGAGGSSRQPGGATPPGGGAPEGSPPSTAPPGPSPEAHP